MTADNAPKVVEIIKANPDRRYVLPSAVGKRYPSDTKATDLFYRFFVDYDQSVKAEIIGKYLNLAKALNVEIDKEFFFDGVFAKGQSKDFYASRGEYLSAKILALALNFTFVDSEKLILFSGDNLREKVSVEKLQKTLKALPNAVVSAYYGSNCDGIKTFTRGGSDVSGALVAAAVNAVMYENYTDVNGYLTANPNLITNPQPVYCMSYSQVKSLNFIGADVLHPDTVNILADYDIPLHIKSIYNPNGGGTLINSVENKKGLLGITANACYYYCVKNGENQLKALGAIVAKKENGCQLLNVSKENITFTTGAKIDESSLKGVVKRCNAVYIQALFYGQMDLGELSDKMTKGQIKVYYLEKSVNIIKLVVDDIRAAKVVYEMASNAQDGRKKK